MRESKGGCWILPSGFEARTQKGFKEDQAAAPAREQNDRRGYPMLGGGQLTGSFRAISRSIRCAVLKGKGGKKKLVR